MERIPILRMGNFLLVTIQVDMHDKLALTLQDDLTGKIADVGAKGVLIDISSLEIVDSFIGTNIGKYCIDGASAGCTNGGGWYAAGGSYHSRGTGDVFARYSDRAECRVGHAISAGDSEQPTKIARTMTGTAT